MTKHQADYILRKTVDYIKKNATSLDFGLSDTVRLLSMLKVNVAKNVDDTQQILDILRDQQSAGMKAKLDAIMNGDDTAQTKATPALVPGAALPVSHNTGFSGGSAPPGMPGASMPGAGMSGAGPGAGMPPQSRGSMSRGTFGQSAGGMRPQSEGGFGAYGGSTAAGIDSMLAMLEQMQTSIHSMKVDQERAAEALRHELAEQKRYIEERDTWLEQRLNAIERRCEKVELRNETLIASWNDMDLEEFSKIPNKVESLFKSYLRPGARMFTGNEGIGDGDGGRHARSSSSCDVHDAGDKKAITARIDDLAQKVDQLVAHTEEAAEQRRLLWKIDLGIRQLRQQGPTLESAPVVPTPNSRQGTRQAMRQQMRAATQQSGSAASRSPSEDVGRDRGDAAASSASLQVGSTSTPGRLPGIPGRGQPDRGTPTTPDHNQAPPRPTDIDADRG